ncbi:MAG: TonB-dependent receptor [Rhodothermales bacterium]|nr:TonB-dependent receptor [Rhodothermales bacterium]MBO6779278.1 TonB-dependent receptor [Rhodothermales bacterium]
MRLIIFSLLVLVTAPDPAAGQVAQLTGRVLEAGFDDGLRGANVLVRQLSDSTRTAGVSTDRRGFYRLELPWTGPTAIRISHVGFRAFADTLQIDGDLDFGVVTLQPEVLDMDAVEVQARRERMVIRGDTVEFFAGGFFVPRYTYAESLIEALPGFEMSGGVVMYLGRPVDRVLIDGKAYYGKDVMTALTTMPIEMIEALQVYDQLPDDRRFSGVDDGSREQVINLVTDPNKRRALLLSVGAGGGSADRYSLDSGLNRMEPPHQLRASIGSENTTTPSDGGIARSNKGSLSYYNTFNERTQVRMTWSANDGINRGTTELTRTFLGNEEPSDAYAEVRTNTSDRLSNTLSGSVSHQTDSHYFSWNPRLLVMSTRTDGAFRGQSVDPLSGVARGIETTNAFGSESVTGGFSANWQYNPGERSGFSFGSNVSFSDDHTDGSQSSVIGAAPAEITQTDSENRSLALSGDVGYMRRLGETRYLSVGVSGGTDGRFEDRRALSGMALNMLALDSTLTSDYRSTTNSYGASLNYGIATGQRGLEFGLVANSNVRRLEDDFSGRPAFRESDLVVSGNLGGNVSITDFGSLRMGYSISGASPSADDLQQVVDNSNPLFLRVGNPDLRPMRDHSLDFRINVRIPESSYTGNVSLEASASENLQGSETWYAGAADREVFGILIPAGGQLSRPATLGTAYSLRMSTGLARFGQLGGLNARFSGSVGVRPESINGTRSEARTRALGSGLSWRIRMTRRMFANTNYSFSWSSVDSDLPQSPARGYSSHTGSATFTFQAGKGVGVNASFTGSAYNRTGAGRNTRTSNLNTGLIWRPPFAEQIFATVMFNDLLNSGDTLRQTEDGLFLTQQRVNRLGRHVLFSLSWQFRTFQPERGRQP